MSLFHSLFWRTLDCEKCVRDAISVAADVFKKLGADIVKIKVLEGRNPWSSVIESSQSFDLLISPASSEAAVSFFHSLHFNFLLSISSLRSSPFCLRFDK